VGGLGYLSSTYNRIRLGSNPRRRIMIEDKMHTAEIEPMQNASNQTIYYVKFLKGESVSHTDIFSLYSKAENAVKQWYTKNKGDNV
jgi:hypothetical protein